MLSLETLQEKYKYNPFSKYGKEIEAIISEKQYDADITEMLRLSFKMEK